MGKKLLESLKEHKDANQGKDDFMKANYELIDRYTKGRHLGDIKRVGILQRLKKNEVAGPSGHNSNLRLSGTSIHAKDVKTSETANSEIVDEEEEVVAPGNLPYGFVECYGEGCLSGNEFINGKLNTEDGSFFKISEKEYNDLPAVYTWFCPDHREKPDETSVTH
uniref:Uncharacterized protein n=1 Tax=Panagrolaimus sp. ES5 TaxID=591445 RepID=A0AC34GIR8_9BILA